MARRWLLLVWYVAVLALSAAQKFGLAPLEPSRAEASIAPRRATPGPTEVSAPRSEWAFGAGACGAGAPADYERAEVWHS